MLRLSLHESVSKTNYFASESIGFLLSSPFIQGSVNASIVRIHAVKQKSDRSILFSYNMSFIISN